MLGSGGGACGGEASGSGVLRGFPHPPNARAAEGRLGTVVKVSSPNQHGGFVSAELPLL